MNKKLPAVLVLLVLTTLSCSLLSAPSSPTATPEADRGDSGLGNPASIYCLEQGGTLEIRNTDQGQVGICTLPDGTVCEEWAFYRGECPEVATVAPTQEPTTAPTVQPTPTESLCIDFSTTDLHLRYPPSLATSLTVFYLPPSEEGGPGEPALPAHELIVPEGYRIAYHRWQPQISVYPVDPTYPLLIGNKDALIQLLTTHPTEVEHRDLPFYPPTNAGILFHARFHYLNFQNGSGVAYLAQLGQAYGAISNYDLLYVYQGLTADGQHYVSAYLPINAPGLVDEADALPEADPRYQGDYENYAAQVAAELNALSSDAFTPTLEEIECMVASIEFP